MDGEGNRIYVSRITPCYIYLVKPTCLEIFSVLKNKIDRQNIQEEEKSKLVVMATNKFFTLDDGQMLLASLSDGMISNSLTTTGDVAFLLITALIVLP